MWNSRVRHVNHGNLHRWSMLRAPLRMVPEVQQFLSYLFLLPLYEYFVADLSID